MRNRGLWVLPVGLLVLAAVVSCRDRPPGTLGGRRAAPPPRKKNPLGGCGLCHVDVVDELAGTEHAAYRIACIHCHGRSKAHLADENNEVKPDRVWTKKTVDVLCASCHRCERPQPALTASPTKPRTCADCHGAHKLRFKPAVPPLASSSRP